MDLRQYRRGRDRAAARDPLRRRRAWQEFYARKSARASGHAFGNSGAGGPERLPEARELLRSFLDSVREARRQVSRLYPAQARARGTRGAGRCRAGLPKKPRPPPSSNNRRATISECRWRDHADDLQPALGGPGADLPCQRVHRQRAELLEPGTDRRGRVAGQARREIRPRRRRGSRGVCPAQPGAASIHGRAACPASRRPPI